MWSFRNTKKQGDMGLGVAVGWFAAQGYTISLPLTDSQEYDLIADDGERLWRVQVKTTSYKRNGTYNVSLSVKGGNRSGAGKVKTFDAGEVDALFVVTEVGTKYFIPTTAIAARHMIVLSGAYEAYKVE